MSKAEALSIAIAMRKAFNLGATYWQQADSEYSSQWKKADATKAQLDTLIEDSIKHALEQPVQEPVAIPREWRTALRKLAFMARTSGGTAGRDSGLCAACDEAEALLSKPYTTPPAAPVQPVAMRMPKVGDRVVCIEDESLGTVVYLTAGGSPEIKFDDGSHGTYMVREFAELFGYTTLPAAQEIVCSTGLCHYKPAAPVQPVASLKEADVLLIAEAHGVDPCTKGLYGFYIDCISSQPAAQRQWVELTDDGYHQIIADWMKANGSYRELCEAIDAELKELNA
jgi:hypothetical protein